MSAWGVGRRSGTAALSGSSSDLKAFVDKVIQWIPADVIALYLAGVTALSQQDDGNPSIPLLIVGIVLAPTMVLIGAASSRGRPSKKDGVLALLAAGAFCIWSLAVPLSGWYEIDWVVENPAWVAIIAAIGGIVYGGLAEVVAERL